MSSTSTPPSTTATSSSATSCARSTSRHDGFELIELHTDTTDRFAPVHLDERVPDWKERLTFISGPAELLDDLCEHWEEHGDAELLNLERFQPTYGEGGEEGDGGKVSFTESDTECEADGGQSILVAGEEAGLELAVRLPHGHLPHVRGQGDGEGPRPAQRRGLGSGGPDDPYLHQRARGRRGG